MKKRCVNLLSVLLIVVVMLTLGACGQKRTPQSPRSFQELMTEFGYEVYDATTNTDTGGITDSVLLAIDENYTIEYYGFIDENSAKSTFTSNEQIFENENTTKYMVKEMSFNDYEHYSYSSDNNFYLLSRINNTMLYCVADKEYKDDILEAVEVLGYN